MNVSHKATGKRQVFGELGDPVLAVLPVSVQVTIGRIHQAQAFPLHLFSHVKEVFRHVLVIKADVNEPFLKDTAKAVKL